MKTTTNNIEATTVKTIAILDNALTTLTRIQGNNDVELFTKYCIDFRTSLGVEVTKAGFYVIPDAYTAFIDTQFGSSTNERSKRQAAKQSLVACFDLGTHGNRAKSYLAAACKGKTALEAILPHEWAIIKTKVNKAAKELADKNKAKKVETVEVETVEVETVEVETVEVETVEVETVVQRTTPTDKTTTETNTKKVSFKANFGHQTKETAKVLFDVLEMNQDTSTMVCLARMILAKYETTE
jgi:Zn finger protein HypA/HybF involved in hydrogenase expression